MDFLTPDEQTRLVAFIRDKHGFELPQDRFAEVAFDLFEDITGMEGLPTTDATENINSIWSIYRAN